MDLSIKDAERKKHSALLIGGTKNAYPSSTDTIPPARKFSSFLQIKKKKKKKKKKKDYKHSYQTNSKILWRSTRKRSSAPLKFKMFLLFSNFNQTDFFCHQGEADMRRLIG